MQGPGRHGSRAIQCHRNFLILSGGDVSPTITICTSHGLHSGFSYQELPGEAVAMALEGLCAGTIVAEGNTNARRHNQSSDSQACAPTLTQSDPTACPGHSKVHWSLFNLNVLEYRGQRRLCPSNAIESKKLSGRHLISNLTFRVVSRPSRRPR